MTNMSDREKAFENKYALDQETQFRVEARAVKLLALWVAGLASLTEEESRAYAASIVAANLDEAGFEDVKRALKPMIEDKKLSITAADLDIKLENCLAEAKTQIMNEPR